MSLNNTLSRGGSPRLARRTPPGKSKAYPIVADIKTAGKTLKKATATGAVQLREVWHKISELSTEHKVLPESVVGELTRALDDVVNLVETNKEEILKGVKLARDAAMAMSTEADAPVIETQTVDLDSSRHGKVTSAEDRMRIVPTSSPDLAASRRKLVRGDAESPMPVRRSPLAAGDNVVTAEVADTKMESGEEEDHTVDDEAIERKAKEMALKAEEKKAAKAKAETEKATAAAATVGNTATVADSGSASTHSMGKDGFMRQSSMPEVVDAATEAMRKKKAKKKAAEKFAKECDKLDEAYITAQAAQKAAKLQQNPWSAVQQMTADGTLRAMDEAGAEIIAEQKHNGGAP